MKLSELRPCASCGGKLTPMWYVIRVSHALINPTAGNQVLGLTQMFGGNLALAEVMAPETDCVLITGDKEPSLMTEIHICQDCFLMKPIEMGILMESVNREKELISEGK